MSIPIVPFPWWGSNVNVAVLAISILIYALILLVCVGNSTNMTRSKAREMLLWLIGFPVLVVIFGMYFILFILAAAALLIIAAAGYGMFSLFKAAR